MVLTAGDLTEPQYLCWWVSWWKNGEHLQFWDPSILGFLVVKGWGIAKGALDNKYINYQMHTLQHDSNKTGGSKTRLCWIGSVQQPKPDFGRKSTTNSNTSPLAKWKQTKKKSEKDIKLLMVAMYNQNFDLDSEKRHLKPLVDISKARTGIGLIMARAKLNHAVCCWFSHFA